jgi:hypothetical protein
MEPRIGCRQGAATGRVAGVVAAFAIAAAALPLAGRAGAESWVGARYGRHEAGGGIFEGSGDLDGGELLGVQLGVRLGPLLEVEIAGEHVSEDLRFEEGVFEGITAAGEAHFKDLIVYLSGRVDLVTFPLLPMRGYVGGGLNVHYAEVSVEDAVAAEGGAGDLEQVIEDSVGERTRGGWHALGGVRLCLPALQLAVFVEARLSDSFEADLPQFSSLYAGASLRL